MGFLFNRSRNICKNNPDDDIEDFNSLFEIKALDDLDPWEEEEREIFDKPSESSSKSSLDSASQVQEPVDVPDEDVSIETVTASDDSSDKVSTSVVPSVEKISAKPLEECSQDLAIKPDGQADTLVEKTSMQGAKSHEKKGVTWNNKGVALSRLGKYYEAIEAYDQALQIDPEYSSAWNNKGVVLSRLGKYHEALDAFDRALRIRQVIRS
nr:tetratricopeptide repeat protein [uncultured Methanospirillum sp.]